MSTVVDERVLAMEFDNKKFEKNVATTMSTLDKLKQSLNFKGTSKGLEGMSNTIQQQQLDFKNLEVTACRAGFSIRDAWIKMISSIEHTLGQKMKNIIYMFTLQPINDGLKEYETQMGAIQTILANTESKGSTLEDVNKALDELNAYADKTIYNFTEMTKNIGTFTAAGVDLDTSVSAIQGIANLAAVSGSTSQQASTAMYQLSQALASGTVRLMDWNSVVNAGMGGEVFQNALKRTAKAHGVAIDEIIKKSGSFRESLKEEWLTTEILTETLNHFTMSAEEGSEAWNEYKKSLMASGYSEEQANEILKMANTATDAATKVKTFSQLMDTLKESVSSGWAQTFEIILGDFEEAKYMWSAVSKELGGIIENMSKARNKLLEGALGNSGWDQLMNAGIMDEESYTFQLKKILSGRGVDLDEMIRQEGSIEKALRAGFKDGTIEANDLSVALANLTSKYKDMSDEELKAKGYTRDQLNDLIALNDQIQNVDGSIGEFVEKINTLTGRELLMKSFTNVWNSLKSIIEPLAGAFTDVFGEASSDQLYNIIKSVENFTSKLKLNEKTQENLRKTAKGLFSVLGIFVDILGALFKIGNKVLQVFFNLVGGLLSFTGIIGEAIFGSRKLVKEGKSIEEFADNVCEFIDNIVNSLKNFTEGLKEEIDTSGLNGFLLILKTIWDIAKKVFGAIVNVFAGIGNAFVETFNGSGIHTILDLLNAGLLGGIFLAVKKLFDGVGELTDKFGEIIDGVTGSLQAFQNKLNGEAIKSIATSIAILAGSLLVLSLLDREKLEESLAAMTILFGEIIVAMAMFGKIGRITAGGTLISLAASMLILSAALTRFGDMDMNKTQSGLILMAGCLVTLLGILKLMSYIDKDKGMVTKGAMQLLKLSLVLYAAAGALKILSDFNWDQLEVGLTAMGGALGMLTATLVVLAFLKDTGNMATKGATELLKLSLVLIPAAIGMKMLSSMSWEEIGKGLTVMGAALVALTTALFIVSKIDNLSSKVSKGKNTVLAIGKCTQLTLMASAIGILALSLVVVAKQPWENILFGLGAMTLTLGALIGAVKLISMINTNGAIKNTASMVIMSGSLIGIAVALGLLGKMNWNTLLTGILAMTATLGVLIGAMALLSKISITGGKLLATAGSIAVLALSLGMLIPVIAVLGSMPIKTIATGLLSITAILAVFIAASYLAAPASPALISLAGGVALLGLACLEAGLGVALFAWGLSLVTESIGTAIKTLCQALIDSASVIGQAAAALIVSLIDALVSVSDELAVGLLEMLLNTLESLAKYIPDITEALMDLLVGVLDKLIDYIPELVRLFVKIFDKLFDCVIEALSQVDTNTWIKGLLAVGMFAGLIAAFAAISSMVPMAMVGALGAAAIFVELALLFSGIGWLFDKADWLVDGINKFGNIAQALGNAIGKFAGGLLGGIGEGITGSLPAMATDLGNFMTNLKPFLDGLNSIDEDMLNAAKTLADVILTLTATNIINGLVGFFTMGISGGNNSLASFGTAIGELGSGIKTFSTNMDGVDTDAVKVGADACGKLADLIDAIPAIGGGLTLSTFSSNLGLLGQGLVNFAGKVSGKDFGNVSKAVEAGNKIAEMASKIPSSGGLFNKNGNLGLFSSQIVSFALGIKGFVNIVGSGDTAISFDNVHKAAEAGKAIANMASMIPSTGGLFDKNDSLSRFASQIQSFATGIKGFVNTVGSGDTAIDFSNVSNAATAGEALANMASKVPATGGLFDKNDSLAEFGTNISSFATGLHLFAKTTALSDYGNVTPAITAGMALIGLAKMVPDSGGLFNPDKSVDDMTSFAENVKTFGSAIYAFCYATAGVNFNGVTPAIAAGQALIVLCKQIPDSGWFNMSGDDMADFAENIITFAKGIVGFATEIGTTSFLNSLNAAVAGVQLATMAATISAVNISNMSSFASNIKSVGTGIKDFYNEVSLLDTKILNTKIQGISKAFNTLKTVINIELQDIINNFNNAKTATDNGIRNMLRSMLEVIRKAADSNFKAAGSYLIDKFVEGMKARAGNAKAAAKAIAESVIGQLDKDTIIASATTAGSDFVQGFANGISAGSFAAEAQASAMATRALQAAKEALRINSPSKETLSMGESFDEGLIMGMANLAHNVYKSGSGVANQAVSGLKYALSKATDIIENGIDSQPTIRPILDLTDISNGAKSINGMFNMTPSMGVLANVNSISSAMNKQNQNGSNDDVIAAIKDLSNKLENTSGDTYNINGITYDDGSNVQAAIESLVRAALVGGRV